MSVNSKQEKFWTTTYADDYIKKIVSLIINWVLMRGKNA